MGLTCGMNLTPEQAGQMWLEKMDLQDRVKDLEYQKHKLMEICNAVAHVGVDSGDGEYELQDDIIDKARKYAEEFGADKE